MKSCSHCHQIKPASAFSPSKNTASGLNSWCKACNAANTKKWRAANPEKVRAQNAAARAENPEKVRAAHVAWRRANPEKAKVASQRWHKTHPMNNIVHSARRRAKRSLLPNTFTLEQWHFGLSYFHDACAVCGNQHGFFWTLAADHWIPLSHPNCPGTVVTNMVPLCHGEGGCNNRKGKKYPHNWLVQTYGKKKAAAIEARIAAYFALVGQ